MDERVTSPDNYEIVRSLRGREFTAMFRGQRRLMRIAEHVNIGRGWMIQLLDDGDYRGIISEKQISEIEAEK